MSFFKHVGSANNKKVIIVQRQLNGEESHMAAILYSDILPTRYHDDVMKVLESEEGQSAYEFKDVLQRRMMADGNNMLQALSGENYIKRVAQNAVTVKPNSKSTIRLDELVKLLNEAGKGESAVKKLDEMDRQLGMNDDPSKTNAARNNAKKNATDTDSADTMHYDTPAAPALDSTQMMMMEMMKTMQAMQKEIADMNKSAKKSAKAAKTTAA
jgi:hypothetical protein